MKTVQRLPSKLKDTFLKYHRSHFFLFEVWSYKMFPSYCAEKFDLSVRVSVSKS